MNPIGTRTPPGSMLDDKTRDALDALVERWQVAAMLVDVATMTGACTAPEDLWDVLLCGTTISAVVTSKRWQVVARLLRRGEVMAWAQLGDVLGMTETDTRNWVLGNLRAGVEWFDCHPNDQYGGMSRAEFAELHRHVEEVQL